MVGAPEAAAAVAAARTRAEAPAAAGARPPAVAAVVDPPAVAAAVDSAGGSGGGGGGADAGVDPITAARQQCVQIINMYRATLVPPSPALTENTSEESCVDGQAKADAIANVAHSAFGQCHEFAQDECPNWPGPPSSIMTNCLKAMWAEGPPPAGQDNHWLNMSNASYTKVACGFYQDSTGGFWATQDFW